jgi:hypothetical protein
MHEIVEARDVRMGMFGHSNQPAHHIPFAYLHTGRPDRTQEIVREVMRRFHAGSQIGQGYGGDEDNGEMSAWQVFAALGLYPAAVGSDVYVLGSPLYGSVTVQREDGTSWAVTADGQSHDAVYVQQVSRDGQPHERTWLTAAELASTTALEFTMGTQPGVWGRADDALPPSLSADVAVPDPLTDVLTSASTELTALVDDRSAVGVELPAAGAVFSIDSRSAVELYTLTSPPSGRAPSAWRLEASSDGATWQVVDERADETFAWPRFTRPFRIASPRPASSYRLVVTAGGSALAEVELLAHR